MTPTDAPAEDLIPESNSEIEQAQADDPDRYVPDPRSIWASEASRAMIVVLARRLGPDFAREVHNEIFARTVGYEEGCPDDQRDGSTLEGLLAASFWDKVFAAAAPKR